MDPSSVLPWVRCADRQPKQPGVYLVYAESADPNLPLYMTAWYEPGAGWGAPLPAVWAAAVSHWLTPTPPEDEQ